MTILDKHQLRPLLTRALAGDAAAWDEFFRQIRKYLHAEVRKVLGPAVHGPVDHSVIVQSTLRRVWEQIGERFPDGGEDEEIRRFFGWVRKIVRNRSWEECRRVMTHAASAAGSAVEGLADTRPREQVVWRDRVAVAVAAALARLPARDQQVVELFWLDGLADVEISARVGCSLDVVRVLRYRALRKLRSPKLLSLLEESHDGQR
jgi:RNA polymerase sigma factor (sigma-70 family)